MSTLVSCAPPEDENAPPHEVHAAGLLQCRACLLLMRRPAGDGVHREPGTPWPAAPWTCPRCSAAVHDTGPPRLAAPAALLVAAALLYLPSNLLPIMHTQSVLGPRSDTVLSGIAELWHTGSWLLALIVFVASVLVPLLKLGVLGVLVVSVHRRWPQGRRMRTRLYHLIEAVGRWSMLDVFVVGLLGALVRLGSAAEVIPGPGAVAFCAVVALTLWATHAFDPRWIWLQPPSPTRLETRP